jgi:hypothetical protein
MFQRNKFLSHKLKLTPLPTKSTKRKCSTSHIHRRKGKAIFQEKLPAFPDELRASKNIFRLTGRHKYDAKMRIQQYSRASSASLCPGMITTPTA